MVLGINKHIGRADKIPLPLLSSVLLPRKTVGVRLLVDLSVVLRDTQKEISLDIWNIDNPVACLSLLGLSEDCVRCTVCA